MKSLDNDAIAQLLKPVPATPARVDTPKGPLDVLIQSTYCAMCLRQPRQVTAMYTVNGEPLCAPHAMYRLSLICVENGYKVEVVGKVSIGSTSSIGGKGLDDLPGQL